MSELAQVAIAALALASALLGLLAYLIKKRPDRDKEYYRKRAHDLSSELGHALAKVEKLKAEKTSLEKQIAEYKRREGDRGEDS